MNFSASVQKITAEFAEILCGLRKPSAASAEFLQSADFCGNSIPKKSEKRFGEMLKNLGRCPQDFEILTKDSEVVQKFENSRDSVNVIRLVV